MLEYIFWGLFKGTLGFIFIFAYASFFEWALHKYLMHTLTLPYSFRAHALVHHGLFRADFSYHIQPGVNRKKVTFAWWNAPLMIGLHMPLLLTLGWLFGWSVTVGGVLAMASDYVLYEYIHYCMHVPNGRWVEKTSAFKFVNRHHYIHHRFPLQNLNVVNVLADWVIGTMRKGTDIDLTQDPIVYQNSESRVADPSTSA